MKTLLFDISHLSLDEYVKIFSKYRLKYNYIALWASNDGEVLMNGMFAMPSYESEEHVIKLNTSRWAEYLLIQHLDVHAIIDYFTEDQTNDSINNPVP